MSNRVALLITNIEFHDKRYSRQGAEKDEENMEILLTSLGFEVVRHRNCTGEVKKKQQKNGKCKKNCVEVVCSQFTLSRMPFLCVFTAN